MNTEYSLSKNIIHKVDQALGVKGKSYQAPLLHDYYDGLDFDDKTFEIAKGSYIWEIDHPKEASIDPSFTESTGIVLISRDESTKIFEEIRQLLADEDVIVYRKGMDMGWPEKFFSLTNIIVVPTTDQYDVFRIELVQGNNRWVSPQDVIKEVKRLDQQFGVDIVDGGVFLLKRTPTDEEMKELGQWLHEFCVDVYDEPPNSLPNNEIGFWWD